jgi:SAM-dependent methyltransferase
MPFADGSFTGVVAFTMLHHVSTMAAQDSLFSEARRVLRPGGVFAGFDGVDSLLFQLIRWIRIPLAGGCKRRASRI